MPNSKPSTVVQLPGMKAQERQQCADHCVQLQVSTEIGTGWNRTMTGRIRRRGCACSDALVIGHRDRSRVGPALRRRGRLPGRSDAVFGHLLY